MKIINGVSFKLEPSELFPHFNCEITFDDLRSNSMPEFGRKGTVIGIRLTSVELRVNNVVAAWYPLNSTSVLFYLT